MTQRKIDSVMAGVLAHEAVAWGLKHSPRLRMSGAYMVFAPGTTLPDGLIVHVGDDPFDKPLSTVQDEHMTHPEDEHRTYKAAALARTLVETGTVDRVTVGAVLASRAVRALLLAATPDRKGERWSNASDETWALAAVVAEAMLPARS